MDLTAVSAVLGSIKTATDIARLIKDTDISLEKAETKLKLADLISALADAKLEVVGVQQAMAEVQARVQELEQRLKLREQVVWEEPCYWVEEEELKHGPYCQKCYDSDGKLVRLQGDGQGYFQCLACNSNYVTRDRRAREDAAVHQANHWPRGGY